MSICNRLQGYRALQLQGSAVQYCFNFVGLLRGKIKNVLELPTNHLKTACVHPRDTEG